MSEAEAKVTSTFETLPGKQLIAVCFVLDYINFQFEDLVFSAL